MSGFLAAVERWRTSCRKWAAHYAARYKVTLDESDLLALINHESKGDVDEDVGGYWGLGQVGKQALETYNTHNADAQYPFSYMRDAARGDEQCRVIAFLVAWERKVCATWHVPDAKSRNALWADATYGWGSGHMLDAISAYRTSHGGTSPTFDQLAAANPKAGWNAEKNRYDVRPWYHARTVTKRAQQDRKEGGPQATPFPGGAPVVDLPARCDPGCCDRRSRGGDCPLEAK